MTVQINIQETEELTKLKNRLICFSFELNAKVIMKKYYFKNRKTQFIVSKGQNHRLVEFKLNNNIYTGSYK